MRRQHSAKILVQLLLVGLSLTALPMSSPADELIINGDFETAAGAGIPNWVTGASPTSFNPSVHSGVVQHDATLGAVLVAPGNSLGGYTNSGLSQQIHVPRDAVGSTLTFYYQWKIMNPFLTQLYMTANFGLGVEMVREQGSGPLVQPTPTPGWTRVDYYLDLPTFSDQDVQVYFVAYDDGISDTNYILVDDVSLDVITATITPTPTFTITPTISPTSTITPTLTITETPTDTFTITPTRTESATLTWTPTVTPTLTISPSLTISSTPADSPTITPTGTISPTRTQSTTMTETSTPGDTATFTPTSTVSPTLTASASVTPTLTVSPVVSATFSPTISPTLTVSPVVSATSTETPGTIGTEALANVQLMAKIFTPNGTLNREMVLGFQSNLLANEITVTLFTVSGRKLISVTPRNVGIGYEARWDGRDDSGREQPAGIYVYRVKAGDRTYRGAVVIAR